jgi:hypothetical protein
MADDRLLDVSCLEHRFNGLNIGRFVYPLGYAFFSSMAVQPILLRWIDCGLRGGTPM